VIAIRGEQTITITASDKVSKLLVHLDDRMMDLDREVKVMRWGKELFASMPSRTVAVMLRSLAGRGDPQLMFDAEIALDLTAKK
jgi:hypothetical protein